MNDVKPDSTEPQKTSNKRRIRMLWVGLVVYFLIMLNTARYARQVPYQVFVLAAVVNMGIIISMFIALKRAYTNVRK